MKIGVCGSPELVRESAPGDFDFVEGHVQNFLCPESPEKVFTANLRALKATDFFMPAANCFLPPDLRVTGPSVDEKRLVRYARTAFRRGRKTGIKFIVFGSAGARNVPPGWSLATGFEQYVATLRLLGPIAREYDVTLLVEPLERGESNLVNTILEGAVAVARAARPRVKLLVDIFHMLRNGESPDDIVKVGPWIKHVHIAENQDRAVPGTNGEDFLPYLSALKAVNYRGMIALEPKWRQFKMEAGPGVAELKRQLAASGF